MICTLAGREVIRRQEVGEVIMIPNVIYGAIALPRGIAAVELEAAAKVNGNNRTDYGRVI